MSYRVLARKYRPQDFSALIGQEPLVRTLTNAIGANRIPHAFVLTGIRGIGKTTTARVIAKALNCEQGASASPCNTCSNCVAITESRHVDVLEMDAASRTGINDIREIIDSVQYMPTMGRYKIYIIDEVHMLSKAAFNGLLKTLEEPPKQVIFIFATTEIRKIPVTILSRCMRFDLARVESGRLVEHLESICAKESFTAEAQALNVIADAAEGSVRDSLSMLDQAMALVNEGEEIKEDIVRKMLGLVGWQQMFGLLEPLFKGEIEQTLEYVRGLYQSGADPVRIMEDLMQITHMILQLKAAPKIQTSSHMSDSDLQQARGFSEQLSVPYLVRLWQGLMKGFEEIKMAPQPLMALEMTLIRLSYISDMPSPNDLIKKIQGEGSQAAPSAPVQPSSMPARAPMPEPVGVQEELSKMPTNFKELVELFKVKHEPFLHQWLVSDVYPIICAPGRFEFRPSSNAPAELAGRISEKLKLWTGQQWVVILSNEEGEASIKDQEEQKRLDLREETMKHPAIQEVLSAFPNTNIQLEEAAEEEDPRQENFLHQSN